jgi:hypothetical protein
VAALKNDRKNMRKIFVALLLVIVSAQAHSKDNNRNLDISCKDFNWGDVEELVQPYLNETLYVALVMQGQNSEYRTSAAAKQAMDKSLPEVVKRILESLIEAGC